MSGRVQHSQTGGGINTGYKSTAGQEGDHMKDFTLSPKYCWFMNLGIQKIFRKREKICSSSINV